MATGQKTNEKDTGSRTLQPSREEPAGQLMPQRRGQRDLMFGMPNPFSLMRRMFDDFAGLMMPELPRVDLLKRDNDIVAQVDLPGMSPDDVRVTIDDNLLIVEGERRDEREDRQGDVYTAERMYGRFRRVIQLPVEVDPATTQASFDAGVLEVTMRPLTREQQRGRNIEIKRGRQPEQRGKSTEPH